MVGFLDVSSGSGTLAPRRQQAYTSKRLQQLVTQHRKEQAKRKADSGNTTTSAEPSADSSDDEVNLNEGKAKKAAKRVKRQRKTTQGNKTAETSGKRTARAKPNRKSTRGSAKGSQKLSMPEEGVSLPGDEDQIQRRQMRVSGRARVDRDDDSIEDGDNSSDEYRE